MPAPVVIRRASARPSLLAQAWALHDAAQKKEAKAARKGDKAPPADDAAASHRNAIERTKETLRGAAKLAHPKDDLVRSEPYLRLVAAGVCEHCGVSGYSQAAHLPPEGKGIKVSDLETFALCTIHRDAGGDLVEGCHKRFDHYELFPREAAIGVARKWVRKTQRRVLTTGKWPKNVPVPAWLEKSNAKTKPQDEAAAQRVAVPDPRRDRKPPGNDARRGAAAGGRNARGPAKRAGRDRK